MADLKDVRQGSFARHTISTRPVFAVEFDGEHYHPVVPSQLIEQVSSGFSDEADAWAEIVMLRSSNRTRRRWTIENPKRCACALWRSLGDIPTNKSDEIEQGWLLFEKGVHREAIWQWFEDYFDVSVADDLMTIT